MTEVNRAAIAGIIRRAILQCLPADALGPPRHLAAEDICASDDGIMKIKKEIIDVGKKLWQRGYVDGNGGNISYRIGSGQVICTPSMYSKGDLAIEDLVLVDMENRRLCGERQSTSEILLHLEIYKAVPKARAIIHCHPPHATAFAIAGLTPAASILAEPEVFVGPVALAPYETPGSKECAETVLPFVRRHNTILMANHGVVCWADTVTHAEWLVEVVDTYCRTLILASMLGAPIIKIPEEKIPDLLRIKIQLGLPDARLDPGEEASISAPHHPGENKFSSQEINSLVEAITSQLIAFITGGQ